MKLNPAPGKPLWWTQYLLWKTTHYCKHRNPYTGKTNWTHNSPACRQAWQNEHQHVKQKNTP